MPVKSNLSSESEGYFKVLSTWSNTGNIADFKAQRRQLSSLFFTLIITFLFLTKEGSGI